MTLTVEQRALEAGRLAFGDEWRPALRAVAPGRIELLGNHVDYNGGPVLCAAIDRSITCLADLGGSSDEVIGVFPDSPGANRFATPVALGDWQHAHGDQASGDYLRGVVATAAARGAHVRGGARMVVAGDVPLGLGLSSSAALCVAMTLLLHEPPPAGADLVLRAQEAEHRAGTPCGTMDQSASVAGEVILFDGATLGFERLQPDLHGYVFLVLDSGVSRSLAHSSYGARVRESNAARGAAATALGRPLATLAAIEAAELPLLERAGLDPLSLRRIRHITSEIERVRRGVEAVQAGDWVAFGALMSLSGQSSAIDYEISHPRVEELVAEVRQVPGVLGARMMGGGEGGAVLALAGSGAVDRIRESLDAGYFGRHGLTARPDRLVECAFARGARLETFSVQ